MNSAAPAKVIYPSRFPFYVEPITEEALLSWLMRLALRLRVSRYTLVSHGVGAAAHAPCSRWWCRPDPMFLALVSRKTGVSCEKVLALTFQSWSPEVRDDEAAERFSAQRFIKPALKRPLPCRAAVCPQCLKEDGEPHLRLTWMLGWFAICPRHLTTLVSRCPACRARPSSATFNATEAFISHRCPRCGLDLASLNVQRADARVLQLQETLLAGKRTGAVELPSLGAMGWSLAVTAVDVLLGMIWSGTAPSARARLYTRVVRDFGLEPQTGLANWTQRYGALLLLTWLLDRWPRNTRVVYNFLVIPHLPRLIDRMFSNDVETRIALKEIFRGAIHRHRPQQIKWKRWLDELPLTAQQLRERASQERYDYRRVRLRAIAQLREGSSVATVAAATNLQTRTIYSWLHCATTQGLEAALERVRGRQQLTSAQAAELAHWMASCSHPGQPGFRFLRSRQVIEEAQHRFGIEITDAMARRLLRMHSFRRRPRFRKASTEISAPVRNLRT